MSSLERLFHSNIPMSPAKPRHRRNVVELNAARTRLNRATYALAELKKARTERMHLERQLSKHQPVNYLFNTNEAPPPVKIPARLQRRYTQLRLKIPKLEREYYKLARRAALINNANFKSGPLNARELNRLHKVANMVKRRSIVRRTSRLLSNEKLVHLPLAVRPLIIEKLK